MWRCSSKMSTKPAIKFSFYKFNLTPFPTLIKSWYLFHQWPLFIVLTIEDMTEIPKSNCVIRDIIQLIWMSKIHCRSTLNQEQVQRLRIYSKALFTLLKSIHTSLQHMHRSVLPISAPQSKNTVSTNVKHSRYIHLMSSFSAIHLHTKRLCMYICLT